MYFFLLGLTIYCKWNSCIHVNDDDISHHRCICSCGYLFVFLLGSSYFYNVIAAEKKLNVIIMAVEAMNVLKYLVNYFANTYAIIKTQGIQVTFYVIIRYRNKNCPEHKNNSIKTLYPIVF